MGRGVSAPSVPRCYKQIKLGAKVSEELVVEWVSERTAAVQSLRAVTLEAGS
jgi:hypothetical protein